MENSREVSITELLDENRILKKRLEILESMVAPAQTGLELDELLRIEEALAVCSRCFAEPGEVDIDCILELIGQAVGGHRACIYEFESNSMVAHNTYEWCAPGIASKMQELKKIDLDMFPWSLGEVVAGRVVNMPDTTSLPPEAANERDILLWAEIHSMVAVPIFNAENKLSAWMGFVDTVKSRVWREEDIRLLRVVAEMLGVYWERQRAEQEILYRLGIEKAIADCSRLLVWGKEIDVQQMLEKIGRAVSVHRVCIYEYSKDNLAGCQHEWYADDYAPIEDELRTLDLSLYSWGIKQVINNEALVIEDTGKLPREAMNEKIALQRLDIESLLAVPVWDAEHNLKAFMGYTDTLSHRKWLAEDLRCLHVVAEMLGTYWERRRAEEEIIHRLTVEKAIAEASRCFLQAEETDIHQVIELIGTAVKANRAYLFQINQQNGLVDCTYEWCDETTDSHISMLKNLDYSDIEWWVSQLLAGETIVIPQIDWSSGDSSGQSKLLAQMNAKSLVMVPIFGANHRPLASLGFDDVHGRKVWLEEDIRCLRMVGGMLGAYWERQENEKALRHSESRFRLLAEITPAFTYVTNMQMENPLLYLNSAVSSLSGYSFEEISNMDAWEIYHPDDKAMLIERGLARLRGEEVPKNYEVRFVKKDGTIGYGMLSSAKIEWEGEPALITVVYDISDQKNLLHKLSQARDQLEMMVIERTSELIKVNKDLYMEINERKQIEEELRKSEANFKKLAEASPALIYVIDTENLRYINSAGENMVGYSREEMMSGPFNIVLHDDYKDLFEKFGLARRQGKYIPPYEMKLVHRDGTEIWGLLSGDVIDYEGVKCNIGAILDITEHKKMEEELIRRDRLETLGLLAGGIAHDFNNILTVISGNASLAQMVWQGDEDDEICSLLDDIKTAALQATSLTSQLLTFSKGGAPFKQSLAVQELVMESARFSLAGSNIRCTFSFAEDLWAIDVDREQMSQVINHLVSNACQAMPQGGEIRLEIDNLELAETGQGIEAGKFVRVAVIDQGHGIDEVSLTKIFNPYYTTRDAGRGMGLAVTDSIVRRHGGSVEVRSNPNQGTTFEVFIPASNRSSDHEAAEEEFGLGGQGRILVMDDEEYIRIILGRMLKKLGYEAYMACDGEEAIEYYTHRMNSNEPFDAVIMDLTIPGGMGGSEAVEELLKIDPGVKAIVSSGYSSDPVMANYIEYGFCGVIPKPYEISKLNRVLREVLCSQSA